MNRCRLIVFDVEMSEGVAWEMSQAFTLEPFKPVLLCISQSPDSLVSQEGKYGVFRRLLAGEVPETASRLPRDLGELGYFLFQDRENVIGFPAAIGGFPLQILDALQPGLGIEVLRKEKRRKRIGLTCFGILMLAVILGTIYYIRTSTP